MSIVIKINVRTLKEAANALEEISNMKLELSKKHPDIVMNVEVVVG
ncbi:hypothetical protein [Desulfosporosinus sp. SB140]